MGCNIYITFPRVHILYNQIKSHALQLDFARDGHSI